MKAQVRRRATVLFLTIALAITSVLIGLGFIGSQKTVASALEGDGSIETPFLISSAAELDSVRNYLGPTGRGLNFRMTRNISLAGYAQWVPIGTGGAATAFQGNFNGGGYEIAALNCQRPNTQYQGLFGSVYYGTIENLGIGADSKVIGADRTGGITGFLHQGVIRKSYNKGQVGNVLINNDPGGIAGYAENSALITDCYNAGLVNGEVAGGIVGTLGRYGSTWNSATVENCYNVGPVIGVTNSDWTPNSRLKVGGIAGSSNIGNIKNSYNLGKVSIREGDLNKPFLVGAIVGEIIDLNHSAIGTGVYYDAALKDNAGNPLLFAGSGATATLNDRNTRAKTLEQLKQQETYEGYYNFANNGTWYMHEGVTTPMLAGVGGQGYKINYDITFDGNGATGGTMAVQNIALMAQAPLLLNGYTRNGYDFIGWSDSPSGTVAYANGATYKMTQESPSTLYAVWRAKQNQLVFDGNGETGGSMAAMTIATDARASLTLNGFVKGGYAFDGWSEVPNGPKMYDNGATYTMGAAASYTLYARWTSETNTVRFNGNGATGGTMANQGILTDNTANLNANKFTRSGYTFAGWALAPGGLKVYDDGQEIKMKDGGYDLYAVWTAKINKVVFDGNGANGGSMVAQEIATDAKATLSLNGFTKTGYHFAGWAGTPDGAVLYGNGAQYTMGADEGYTLYAKWEANINRIVFNANGGTGSMAVQEIATGAATSLNPNGFTKSGYAFNGWSTTPLGSVEYINGANYTMGTDETVTLYAQWVPVQNAVSFDGNGATGGAMAPQQINETDTEPLDKNLYTRDGYTFIGWALTPSGNAIYDDREPYRMEPGVTNPVLYAKWQANENTLVFNGNGSNGGQMENKLLLTGEETNLPMNGFTRTGYTFVGWSTSSDGAVVYADRALYKMGTNARYNLYAVWQADQYFTVRFEGNKGVTADGDAFVEESVYAGASVATVLRYAPELLPRAGYDFAGWDASAFGEDETLNKNVTLTAKWTLTAVLDPRVELTPNDDGSMTLTAGGLPEIDGVTYTYVWKKNGVVVAGATGNSIVVPKGEDFDGYTYEVSANGLEGGAGGGSTGNVYEGSRYTVNGDESAVNDLRSRNGGLTVSQKIIIAVAVVVGVLLLLLIIILVSRSIARERNKQEDNNYRWY